MTDFDTFGAAPEDLESVAESQLAEAARKVLEGGPDQQDPPALVEPTDGPVRLPAGFRRVSMDSGSTEFEEVDKAWVRELNGEDEERIARVRMKEDDIQAWFQVILERGVEKLGDIAPTKEDLNSLVIGDREYLLMEIARATYGDEIEYVGVTCPHCGEAFDVSLSIGDDIPVKRLEKPGDRSFDVRLRKGVASVALPTGDVSLELGKADTSAEANTFLIANAVNEIRWEGGDVTSIQGNKAAAKRLGLRDRQTLVNAMADRMPGPRYNEVKFNHEPGCGEEIRLPLQLADLFRGL